jgi:hypothetical protein
MAQKTDSSKHIDGNLLVVISIFQQPRHGIRPRREEENQRREGSRVTEAPEDS